MCDFRGSNLTSVPQDENLVKFNGTIYSNMKESGLKKEGTMDLWDKKDQ